MSTKLSAEIINKRLNDRNIRLVGEYLNSRSHSLFECHKGHQWQATPDSVVRGNGCPHCAGNAILSEVDIRTRILKYNIQIISKFSRTKDIATFQCENKHTWETTVNSVLSGHGCPHCKGMILTADDWHIRFQKTNLRMIGEYVTSDTKTLFRCVNGHECYKTPTLALITECPQCAEYGFKPNEEGFGYVLLFDTFLKFGITKNVDRRIYEITKKSCSTLNDFTFRKFSLGSTAKEWETYIKQNFKCGVIEREYHQVGWTETCYLSDKDVIIKLLNEWENV